MKINCQIDFNLQQCCSCNKNKFCTWLENIPQWLGEEFNKAELERMYSCDPNGYDLHFELIEKIGIKKYLKKLLFR